MYNELTLENLPKQVNRLYHKLEDLENLLLEKEEQVEAESKICWLSLDELVEYDPAKRVKATWYSLVSKGQVPYHKTGKHLVFLKSEIDAWLKTGKRKTVTEIEAEAEAYLSNNEKGLNDEK